MGWRCSWGGAAQLCSEWYSLSPRPWSFSLWSVCFMPCWNNSLLKVIKIFYMFFGGLDFYIYVFDLSEYIWGVVWVRYLSLACFYGYGYLYGCFYLCLWIVKHAYQPFHQPFWPFSSDVFNVISAMYPVPMYVWSLSGVSSYILFVYLCTPMLITLCLCLSIYLDRYF